MGLFGLFSHLVYLVRRNDEIDQIDEIDEIGGLLRWGYIMKRLAVLGSTGSIGMTTLALVEQFPERFQVVTLAAGKNLERLREQVIKFQPELVSLTSEESARELRAQLPHFRGEIRWGAEGLTAAAVHSKQI